MGKYLTKSKFTLSLDCPTKLYYANHKEYRSTMDDNDFLQALAKGGIQVGELAKIYYPGGKDIKTLNYDESIAETNECLKQENVIIYEAAVLQDHCFIRVDVLEKKGKRLNLIEVKSKSWPPDNGFLKNNGEIYSGWQKYLYDVAFQYWMMQHAFPGYQIEPYLMLIDKNKTATIDGLHQHFKVVTDENGRYQVKVKEGVTAEDLGEQILTPVHIRDEVLQILNGEGRTPQSKAEAAGFDQWIHTLVDQMKAGEKYPVVIGEKCKKCEYRISRDKLKPGEKSGFEECWKEALSWQDKDFEKPHVFDIWNERSVQRKYLDNDVYLMKELIPGMLPASEGRLYEQSEWDNDQRKTLQIVKATGHHSPDEAVAPGLFHEMESWTYPLHFIDFEAVLAAIPFHKGMKPYDFVPFQFSCHTVYEDGRVEHRADWIEEEPGKFPCIEFVRQLKTCLEGDNGTVFRFHNFENAVLNNMAGLIQQLEPDDGPQLLEFIGTLVRGGEREMVDQWQLVKKYYYSPHMGGSISIKDLLPAALNESNRLKEIYTKPYSGLYIKDKIFYKEDPETGIVMSPYKLLDPVGQGLPYYEEGNRYLDNQAISEGGTAMMAWSRIQFDDIDETERQAILHSLYQYCELDTLAMLMIQQHWEYLRDIGR